jgi:predicted phage-related endonuclease
MEQRTEEWHQARLGKVTASRITDVMAKPETAAHKNYLAELVCERLTGIPTESFCSADMQRGIDLEPAAKQVYSFLTGHECQDVGFVDHPGIGGAGCSPDIVIVGGGLAEIKCPKPAKHIAFKTGATIDSKWLMQIQFQMACTGEKFCDFVSYCPELPGEMQLFIKTIKRDKKRIEEIESAVVAFLGKVDDTIERLTEA